MEKGQRGRGTVPFVSVDCFPVIDIPKEKEKSVPRSHLKFIRRASASLLSPDACAESDLLFDSCLKDLKSGDKLAQC